MRRESIFQTETIRPEQVSQMSSRLGESRHDVARVNCYTGLDLCLHYAVRKNRRPC